MKDVWVLLFIVFFVSFGLAVLSMCAELAASELKWIFMKIHYFGRKIGRRQVRCRKSWSTLALQKVSLFTALVVRSN